MADVNQGTELAVADGAMGGVDMAETEEQKSGLLGSLGNVDVLRQITLILALAICLAIAVFIIIWARQPDFRPLGKFPTDELVQTLDFLDANKIDYQLDGGDTILVKEDEYQSIKLLIKREGLEQAPDNGTDILMQDMGFGVSQRMERERLKHSREQQLARTIEEFSTIARAKVLLAIPKENVFARRTKKPSATVVLTMKRGRHISDEEVDSVVDVVASAVNGMEPGRVTVTDQNGRLLNSGSQDSLSSRSRKEYEIEKNREDEYISKIDSILIPVLGVENYTAQVDVTMDFSAVEQTQKRYNPDLPAIRSEMTLEDNSIGGLSSGIPGALTNQPPLESAIPEEAVGEEAPPVPGRQHRETTRNYELDETISHTRQQTGVIRRLSVSVAVDYRIEAPEADAEAGTLPTRTPRTQQELANIRRILQGGLGFDVQRGDTLEVVTIPFERPELKAIEAPPLWEQPWFMKVVRLALAALVIIVLILAVVRPMLKKLIYPEEEVGFEDELDTSLDLGDDTLLESDFDEGDVGFQSDGTLKLPDLHRDEDVLKAVRALVANEPELSSQVVKSWLSEDD